MKCHKHSVFYMAKKKSQTENPGPFLMEKKLQGDNAYDAESHGKQRARKAPKLPIFAVADSVSPFFLGKETTPLTPLLP